MGEASVNTRLQNIDGPGCSSSPSSSACSGTSASDPKRTLGIRHGRREGADHQLAVEEHGGHVSGLEMTRARLRAGLLAATLRHASSTASSIRRAIFPEVSSIVQSTPSDMNSSFVRARCVWTSAFSMSCARTRSGSAHRRLIPLSRASAARAGTRARRLLLSSK